MRWDAASARQWICWTWLPLAADDSMVACSPKVFSKVCILHGNSLCRRDFGQKAQQTVLLQTVLTARTSEVCTGLRLLLLGLSDRGTGTKDQNPKGTEGEGSATRGS